MKLAWIIWLSHVLPQPAADSLCLSTTVYLEARDQTTLGQQAVAEVAAAAPCPAAQAAPAVPAAPAKPSELEGPVVDGTRTDVVTDQNEVDDLLARMGF